MGPSLPAMCALRQLGLRASPQPARPLQLAAEDNLVAKRHLTERHCEVPDEPRSTFLMVFSPDGTKVASTHGNHNVYVSELSSGKHVKTLSGHPRTPWCVAFHPSHTQLLASGCLGGQVRVWDLSGGSEVWTVGTETVIASIAFHPRDQLLVIATFNELHFWDWSIPAPFISVKTNSIKSKVRFVAFDALGHKLITGISCWNYPTTSNSIVQPVPHLPPENSYSRLLPASSSHEQIVSSYHHLVQRYDSLVRNYHHLIMGGTQPANTTDRGTDPMEVDWSPNVNTPPRSRASSSTSNENANTNNDEPTNSNSTKEPSTSRSNSTHQPNIIKPPSTSNQSNSQFGESSLLDPRPSTSQSAFQPVSSSTNTSNGNSQVTPPSNTSTSREPSTNTSVPNQALRNELTASLNRLQGFMENSIDQTLNLWERYDAARSSSLRLMNLLREFPLPRTTNTTNPYHPQNLEPSVTGSDPVIPNPSFSPHMPYPAEEEYSLMSDRPRFVELSPEDFSQNSESSNDNIDDQRFDAINDVLRESGSRLLNLLAGMRSSRGERFARIVSQFQNNLEAVNPPSTSATDRDNTPPISPESRQPPVNRFEHLGTTATTFTNTPSLNTSNMNSSNPLPLPRSGLLQLLLNRGEFPGNNDADNIDIFSTSNNDSSLSSSSRETDELTHSNNIIPDDSPIPSTNDFQQSNPEASSSRIGQERPSDASRSNDAFDRVTRGVQAIERHTDALISQWNSGQTSLRIVRGMWEDLRREIISLQRSSDHESPGGFSLPPLDRCRLLNNCINRPRSTGVNRGANTTSPGRSNAPPPNTSNSTNSPRTHPRPRPHDRNCANYRLLSLNQRIRSNLTDKLSQRMRHRHDMCNQMRNINPNPDVPFHGNANPREHTPTCPNNPSTSNANANPSSNSAFRGRQFLSLMRRHRGRQVASRSRIIRLQEIGHRRNVMNIRRGELDVTRDRIRMRARRVLAIMFSIMMDCLEADQLSNRIITMLRLLKKALSVTCLLLVSHLFYDEHPRPNPHSENNASSSQDRPPNEMAPTASGQQLTANSERPTVESNSSAQPAESGATNNQNSQSSADSLASRIQEHSNDVFVQIRRSRTLLRLDPLSRIRRRVPYNSRNADAPLSSPMQHLVSNNNIELPTDNIPQEDPAANVVSSSTGDHPSHSHQPTSEGSSRMRQMPWYWRSPQRPLFSRPSCIYRRFLFNHRLMGNMLQVIRHQDNLDSNREHNVPPGYISRMVIESMRRRENANRDQNPTASQNLSVPLVHVNDVPINDVGPNPENPQRSQPSYSRADYLHPVFAAQNVFPNDENESRWSSTTIRFTTECPSSSVHRIQVWDFTQGQLPDISNVNKNIVVRKCKIHNDASIDISRDGRLLVALLPAQRMGNITHLLGIFSLEWNNLGECLYTTLLEQNAVSVSLSPCARHLAVGLGSRRVSLLPYVRNGVMAVIFRLGSVKMKENDTRLGSLIPIRSLEQSLDSGFTSLNCLRWAPQPGQGLVYANNKGQLKILS